MADNAIASGAAVLTANADGLAAGLKKASADVDSWGASITSKLGSIFKGGAFLAGGAIGVGIAAVGHMAEKSFEKLGELGAIQKQASALGVSASAFQGLGKVMERAGIQAGQVSSVFVDLGKNISDSAAGRGRAQVAFQALGLDAAKLKEMKPDEQFLAIAEAFKQLGPGADASAAAVKLFGGNAAALLPFLQKGEEGIGGLLEEMRKSGAVLGDDQIATAASASKAWKKAKLEIGEAFEGMAAKGAVAFAPIVEQGAHAIEGVFNLLSPIIDWQSRAYGRIFEVGGKLFEELSHGAQELYADFSALVGSADDLGVEFPTVEQVIVTGFKYIAMAAGYAWDAIKVGAGGVAIGFSYLIDGLRAIIDLFKDIASLARKLPDDIRPAGLDRFLDAVDNTAVSMGKASKDLREFGFGTFDKFGDTADKWGGFFDGLKFEAKKAGKEAGEVFADEMTVKAAPVFEAFKLAGAVEGGSKEAYSLSVKNQIGGEWMSATDAIKEHSKKTDKSNDLLKNIDRKLTALSSLEGA